jgi:hypothetical protein
MLSIVLNAFPCYGLSIEVWVGMPKPLMYQKWQVQTSNDMTRDLWDEVCKGVPLADFNQRLKSLAVRTTAPDWTINEISPECG